MKEQHEMVDATDKRVQRSKGAVLASTYALLSEGGIGGVSMAWQKGFATGPNPTDRGKPATKRRLVTDRRGIPPAAWLKIIPLSPR